jgi:predicted GNAT family N-acyltransferase
MTVVRADTEDRYEDALAVRFDVFVEEQGVPEDLEVDEYEDVSRHFVAYDEGGEPVGAARLREYEPDVGKVERVAVLADRRGEGWGVELMAALEDDARGRYDELFMHAQLDAAAFYDRLGYEREGEEFEEAGIPHVAMRKELE